ncbi:hypothetical protein [Bacteroides sp. 224]|uniref:hypothetical protein n=1 Tax=Bacteroides sp. 224 TaxID=2302936 RepID=UPI0013D8CBD6|nr:hypothetical protein [Bacteroides sp. 224]
MEKTRTSGWRNHLHPGVEECMKLLKNNSGNTYTNTTAIVLSSDQTYEQGERYSMTAAMQLQ